MKRFKNYSIMILSLAILIATMIFSSCDETNQQTSLNEPSGSTLLNKSAPKESGENPQKRIGEMHNEALDAVYFSIKENSSKIRCIDDLINTAQKGMNEYWWNKKVSCEDQAIKKAFEKHNYKSYIIPKENFLTKLSSKGLTNKQLTFIDGFYSLVYKKMSMNDLKNTIAVMNVKAVKELGETDAKHVLALSSIVESSYEYHSKKKMEWIELVKSLPIEGKKDVKLSKTSMEEINWDAVWQADVGAFAGAILSCAESLLFTGYPACVAAYTAMASSIVLLYEILTYLFSLL